MKKIAVFASGSGSNAKKIIEDSRQPGSGYTVALVACNNPLAGVTAIAREAGIPLLLLEREAFVHNQMYINDLRDAAIDWIVLAGFLWKLPPYLVEAYPGRILNIHPALLPKYGGKGMYGHHVHEAVLQNRETESGITIHYVDEQYDHGAPVFQVACPVHPDDSPETLAKRIQALEHEHYPRIIRELVNKS